MSEYYTLDKILKYNAHYYIVVGSRGKGKTYAGLTEGLKRSYKNRLSNRYDNKFCYVRRYHEDIEGKGGKNLFRGLNRNNEVSKITNNKFSSISYCRKDWYLFENRTLRNGRVTEEKEKEPICYGFGLNGQEHVKSADYLDINTIIFDEFITRRTYLSTEVDDFLNLVSTIKRERDDIKIFMFANTVSWECPYFHAFGIYEDILDMNPGEIRFITKTDKRGIETRFAIEYTENINEDDAFFANIESNTSRMITHGDWETGSYAILSDEEKKNFKIKNVKFRFYIQVYNDIFEANVIRYKNKFYLYIFAPFFKVKLEDIKKNTLIYSTEYNTEFNYRRDILHPIKDDVAGRRIAELFKADLVFYDSNRTGQMIENFLNII